jgi:hypothetical protein
MRQAGVEYLLEEARARGARPRVKAVLSAFDLDFGLAPESGTYDHTVYGGEPGRLAMAEGYYPTGSWTSPVLQAFSPDIDQLVPAWQAPLSHLEAAVYLRSGETPGAVSGSAFTLLAPGAAYSLAPYFQVKVAFQETVRSWALDSSEEADDFSAYAVDQAPDQGYESYAGDATAYLAGLRLAGYLTLPESDILDPGRVQVELAQDFREFRAADHVLVLDHRQGQWLHRAENPHLPPDWSQKQVELYHGWELSEGEVQWQLVYRGELQRLTGMSHGWRQPHRVRLESQDWVAARLQQAIGAPAPEGDRRPFLRGTYRARGELSQTIAAAVSQPGKTGSGTAALQVLGPYRGEYPQDYLIDVQTGGEVGSATFRWSTNDGQSWQDTDLPTAGADDPVELEEGLAIYWDSGPGPDLAAGDRWTFTAAPAVYQYQVYGAPFEEIAAVYLNGEETWDRVAVQAATGVILVTGRSAQVEARVVQDATTHPIDIMSDILGEVGLDSAIHPDSFALAKSLTPDYAIGVCFENLTAAQALREILRRCLYDLWLDFGEIKVRAYLGE